MSAVGFTGTRGDLTRAQHAALSYVLDYLAEVSPDDEVLCLHHGQCVGGDWEAQRIARLLSYQVHAWPPTNPEFRADVQADVRHAPMTYRKRNEAIVEHSDVLVACPPGSEADWPRSGTWMTVRMARRLGVPRIIIFPDGSTDHDE